MRFSLQLEQQDSLLYKVICAINVYRHKNEILLKQTTPMNCYIMYYIMP